MSSGPAPTQFLIGDTFVDLTARRAGDVDLTEQECALLHALVSRQGEEASKADLYREVWGYRSMPQGRALDYAIRRLRQKLEDDSPKPLYLTSRRGGGFRLEWVPLVNDVGEVQFCPPIIANEWYGDRSQVELLRSRLEHGARITSILGPAGVGKSRLMLEALREYSGDVFWVSLHENRDIWSILADLCDAYKATDVPLIGRLETLIDELASVIGERESVPHLVLDGAEVHVNELTARLGELVKGNKLRVFVTSRTRLGLTGEELIDVSPMEPELGVEFLLSRRASHDTFDHNDLLDLVRLLDGLPLALELVAPLLRMVTPKQLVERLRSSGRTNVLQSEFRPLTSLVEGTIAQLDESQRRLLRVLALLPRGAPLETVEVFLTYVDAGLGTLRELVDRSLVTSFEDGGVGARLRVMWAVRSMVGSSAPDASGWGFEEAREILARHARSFGVVEDPRALFQESNVSVREAMRSEMGQAHVWLEALLASGDDEAAARCCMAFSQLTLWSGSARQAAQILVSTARKLSDDECELWLWAMAATIASEAQEWEDADLFLAKARELVGPGAEGQVRLAYAELVACRQRGDFEELDDLFEELRHHKDNDRLSGVVCSGMLVYANSMFFHNKPERATEVSEQAMDLAKEKRLGYVWIERYNLEAFNCFIKGDFDRAAYAYRRGARVARRFGDHKSIASLERKLSLCLLNTGDFGGAHRARKEALARIDPKMDPNSYARLLSYEAEFVSWLDIDQGIKDACEAVELARSGASIQTLLTCLHRALMIAIRLPGPFPLMSYLNEFEEQAPMREGGFFMAFCHIIRGHISIREGHEDWARTSLERGWEVAKERLGMPEGVALLGNLAELAAELGEVEQSEALLDEARKHYNTGDWPRVLFKRSEYVRAQERLDAARRARGE